MSQSRPPVPQHVKDLVWDRDQGICQLCFAPVLDRAHAEYDHRPALSARQNREEFPRSSPRHYVPNANDPQWIRLLHGKKSGLKCHDKATFGHGPFPGDVSNAAKTKRIHAKHGDPATRTTAIGYSLLNRSPKPTERGRTAELKAKRKEQLRARSKAISKKRREERRAQRIANRRGLSQ